MKKLLSILLVLALVSGLAVQAFAAERTELVSRNIKQANGSTIVAEGISHPDKAEHVLELINIERMSRGLPALTWEPNLVQPAITRALEQDFSKTHTRPDGSSPFTVSEYIHAENLAGGDTNAVDVMEGWMNSPSHRETILHPAYTSVAVACVETDTMYYWVQLFHSNTQPDSPYKTGTAGTTVKTGETTASAAIGESLTALLDAANGTKAVVTATVTNRAGVTASEFAEMAKWATAKGKTAKLTANTTYTASANVQGQISLNPASFTTADMKLGVYVDSASVASMRANTDKWYTNQIAIVKMEQNGALAAPVKVAVKADLTNLDTTALTFYSYNRDTHKVIKLDKPDYSVDKNGYLRFTTQQGGCILVTNGALNKR